MPHKNEIEEIREPKKNSLTNPDRFESNRELSLLENQEQLLSSWPLAIFYFSSRAKGDKDESETVRDCERLRESCG